jgi:hypothetical protein
VTSEQWVIFIGLAQLVVFVLQLFVFRDRARKLAQTVKAAAEQSGDMKDSIKQATRAANAMEEFAQSAAVSAQGVTESVATVRQRTAQQMRAYLCVIVWIPTKEGEGVIGNYASQHSDAN